MPPLALVTVGDPNGIGPEIAIKALVSDQLGVNRPVLVGCPELVRSAAKALKIQVPVREVFPDQLETGPFIPVVRADAPVFESLTPGKPTKEAGFLAAQSVLKAHELITAGKAQLMVTCPINKEALHLAGQRRIAHTEMLAHFNQVRDPITLFVAKGLWIAFFTRHLPLNEAIKAVKTRPLIQFVQRLCQALIQVNGKAPQLVMAALNPHGGEAGLLGREEMEEVTPAISELQNQGVDILGPMPADAVFHLARENLNRIVISLYHDQGHIAAKTLAFHETISLTIGLPYIRTSVDHGTGFDIAWQGRANPLSLIQAINQAYSMYSDL